MFDVMKKKKKRKGFTLVELVVVIAILGILATIAIPKFSSSRKTAAVAAHNANVRIIKSVAVMYLADNPAAKEDITTKLAERFDDGKMPKASFDAAGEDAPNTDFTVNIEEGDIVVSPGEMKIENGEVAPVKPVTP